MGAESFYCNFDGETLYAAFDAAVKDAYYWHGHSGYSGTICEKKSVVAYRNVPDMTIEQAEELFDLLDRGWKGVDPSIVEKFGEEVASEMQSNFDNKWGPAVAFHLQDGSWFFCGMASC